MKRERPAPFIMYRMAKAASEWANAIPSMASACRPRATSMTDLRPYRSVTPPAISVSAISLAGCSPITSMVRGTELPACSFRYKIRKGAIMLRESCVTSSPKSRTQTVVG